MNRIDNWVLHNDTPGPTEYDVKTSLLDGNKNKHYGFIDKSLRFQSEVVFKSEVASDENKERGVLKGINENSKPTIKKNDDVKLRQKEKSWKEMYSKITKIHEKEIKTLEEKISRIETMFQTVVKEKSHLVSSVAVKDKEFLELQAKHEMLLLSLEKADKVAQVYVDKACKADNFEKKLHYVNKANCKMKNIADKKLLQENEELTDKVAKAEMGRSELEKAKKEYRMIQKELNKSCESFETQRLAYLGRINELESELESITIKNQQSVTEIEKLSKIAKKAEYEKGLEYEKCADLKASLEQLQEKNVEQLEKQVLVFRDQISELRARKDTLESERFESKAKNDQKINQMESEMAKLKFLLQKSEEETRKFKLLGTDLSSKNDMLHTNILKLEEQADYLRAEVSNERVELSKQHESSRDAFEQFKKDVAELKKKLVEKEEDFNSLLEKERQISTGLSQKTRDQSEMINSLQEKWTACVSELESQRSEYKMNLSILKSSHEKSDKDFEIQISQLKTQIHELNDDNIKTKEYYQSIMNEEKQLSSGLSVKVRDQMEKIGSMEKHLEMIMLQSKNEKNDLSDELTFTISRYQECQTELAAITSKLSHLESSLSASESSRSNETASLRSNISDLEFLKEKLNGQVQESQSLIQEQNMVIQKLEDSVNEKMTKMQSLSQKCSTMEDEMKDLLKKFTTVNVALEEEKNLHGQTKQESERRISNLESELNEIQDSFCDKDKLLQSMIESEKQKSNTLLKEGLELRNVISSLKDESNSSTQKYEISIDSLNGEISELKSKNEQIIADLENSRSEMVAKDDQYQSITEKCKLMKISIENIMNEMEDKTLELAAALSELSSYKADNGKLIQDLETKIMEKDALVSSLEERIRGSNDELRSTLENLEKLELEFEAAGKKSTDAIELNQKATNSLAKNFEIERTELLGKIANLDIKFNISVNNAKEKDFMLQSLEIKIEELNTIIAKTQQKDQETLKLHEFEKIEMEKDLSKKSLVIIELEKQLKFSETSHESKTKELMYQLQSFEADVKTLQNDIISKDGEIESLETKLQSYDQVISDLESAYEKSNQKAKSSERELETKLVLFNETQEKLIASVSLLQSQLEEKIMVNQSLQESLALSEKGIAELNNRSSELNCSLETQKSAVSNLEIQLLSANERIQNLQKDTEENLMMIKRSEDRIFDLVSQNETLNHAAGIQSQKEASLHEELKASKKLYCELESRMQTNKEDYQVELEELQETLEYEREEFHTERKSFNDRMTSLTSQLRSEILLKEQEIQKTKDLSEDLDAKIKEKLELESKLEEISTKYAQANLNNSEELKLEIVKLSEALEFKTNLFKDTENQLEEAQSRLSLIELRLLNELSSKDMHFKSFEDRLKSKCAEVETLTKSHLEMKKNLLKTKEENKNLISENEKSKSSIARYKQVERLVLVEKKNLETGHKDSQSLVEKYKKEIADLKTIIKELTESNSELSTLYASQSEIISNQGALTNSEMEKISNLNAEVAGHSNSRQKIRYVSNIKQENLALKQENSNLLIERDQLVHRIQSLLADQASLGPIQ